MADIDSSNIAAAAATTICVSDNYKQLVKYMPRPLHPLAIRSVNPFAVTISIIGRQVSFKCHVNTTEQQMEQLTWQSSVSGFGSFSVGAAAAAAAAGDEFGSILEAQLRIA